MNWYLRPSNKSCGTLVFLLAFVAQMFFMQFALADELLNKNAGSARNKVTALLCEAKKKGVGTKPYEDRLAQIDADLSDTNKSEQAQKALNSLIANLEAQVRIAKKPENFSGYAILVSSADLAKWGPAAKLMSDIQKKIKRQWHPPESNVTQRVSVIFVVHKLGQVSDIKIDQSSGVTQVDEAAVRAVKMAAPFLPLSFYPGYKEDCAHIQFAFDYNVHQSPYRHDDPPQDD
jgi:TonB family protein